MPDNRNGIQANKLREDKTPPDTPRDTFAPKSTDSVQKNNPSALPPDLAGIVGAWDSIPLAIRQAVKAIVAPYVKEGDK